MMPAGTAMPRSEERKTVTFIAVSCRIGPSDLVCVLVDLKFGVSRASRSCLMPDNLPGSPPGNIYLQ